MSKRKPPASSHQTESPDRSRKNVYFGAGILIASTFAIYWRTLKYSYVQDDWLFINSFVTSGPLQVLKESFLQIDALFYRPLGTLYMVVVYSLFGANAVGFHVIGLLIHFGNSLLVALILLRITRLPVVSWTTAFLYMAAARIHIDPLMWMVGIYDLGATFFFLLTIYLFTGGRIWVSVLTFVLAILMKDSAIVLPAILFIIVLLNDQEGKTRFVRFGRKLPHVIIAVLYLILRSGGWMRLFVSQQGAYTSGVSIPELIFVLSQYLQWSVESVIGIATNAGIALLLFSIMVLLAVYYFRQKENGFGILILFSGWLFVGLIPPMLIPSHGYRYYLSYSLPAFLAIFTYAVCGACTVIRVKPKMVPAAMIAIVAATYYSSFILIPSLEKITSDTVRMAGSNNLILKGSFVEPVQSYLLRSFRSVKSGSTFIFDVIPASAFGGSAGLRIWFGDSSIRALQVQGEANHLYLNDPMILDPGGSDTVSFDARTTYVVGWINGQFDSFRLVDRYSKNPFSKK